MVAVGAIHLRLLAVTAAACVVVMTVSCSSAGNKSAAPGSNETPKKPEFTQVTSSMFVDRSAVPNSAAMEFTAPSISSYTPGSQPPVDPPECGPMYWGPDSVQDGSVSWSTMRSAGTSTNNEGKVFNLFLAVPAERLQEPVWQVWNDQISRRHHHDVAFAPAGAAQLVYRNAH